MKGHVDLANDKHVRPVQAPDRVRVRLIVIIALVAVAVIAASTWLPTVLRGRDQGERPASSTAAPPRNAPGELSHVEQSSTPQSAGGLSLRAEQERALDGYGWVDRDAGLVHVPIEHAMRLVEERQP